MKLFTLHSSPFTLPMRFVTPLTLVVLLSVNTANARDFPWCPKPNRVLLDARPEDGFERAGHPECIAPWAVSCPSREETGYYIGGGRTFHGEPRRADEGTWGFDYYLKKLPPHVRMQWWHGAREQGGAGAYKTDGPKLKK